jgi:hypothetical protein
LLLRAVVDSLIADVIPTTAEKELSSERCEQMAESVDGGWSFEEALARTSDPGLWDGYQAENRQQAPTSTSLRSLLVADLLAKIGTKLIAAVPKPSAGEWIIVDRDSFENRIADERIDEVIKFFAPLTAPNAVEHLRDRGLAEAFQQCVLDDPEVSVLMERSCTQDRFNKGLCPLGLSDYHWPLDVKASNFEYRLTNGVGLLFFGGPELRVTPRISALSAALVDRIGALRGLLLSGTIQAFGLSTRFGESYVPTRQWARKNLSIDVANGDLCEKDDRGNFLPMWTGVELRTAMNEAIRREEPVQEAIAPTRKRSARGQEVERIIKEKHIDVGQSGRKAAASEVMKYMKKPPESADEKKALETMVGRVWKDRQSGL